MVAGSSMSSPCFLRFGVMATIGLLVARSCLGQETGVSSSGSHYTAFDDASWAVWDVKLSNVLGQEKQRLYDEYIAGCRRAAADEADQICHRDEYHRMQMNMYQPRSMVNYTELGYQKMRAPEDLFSVLQAFWELNKEKGETEWDEVSPYHNLWDSPPTIIKVDNQQLRGGGPDLAAFVSNKVREVTEEWTGQIMSGSSTYGIRIYHNNSILAPHCDRIPLITSAIINVAQDVDEPWPLEVYDHYGNAVNVTMEPGDMVLYESHSVIHGRPFPMKGRYFANIFVHFEVIGSRYAQELPKSGGLPPYLVPGSSWEPEYWAEHPEGWKALDEIEGILRLGDLRTFKYIVERRPEAATMALDGKTGWQPIHEATRSRHLLILEYLVEELGVSVNTPYYFPYPIHPMDVAWANIRDKTHPIFNFLYKHGAERSSETRARLAIAE